MSGRRWAVVIIVSLLVIALIAYARGLDHHRGDEVGEEALPPVVEVVAS